MKNKTDPFRSPRPLALLSLPAFLCAASLPAQADETATLAPVTVSADAESSGAVSQSTDSATKYTVDQSGIDLWAGAGGSNYYRAASAMPSVNAQSADAYGLANIPGGSKGLRVRGELATHGVNGSIEGVPVNGVNPGPGQLWLYDAENYQSVSLAQGPVAADELSIFTTSGSLNTNLRWPGAERGGQVSQSVGSFDFSRTFVRFDTGKLAGGGAFFVSTSDTSASKWRGPGDSPDKRENFEAALSKPLGKDGNFKLYAAYNDMQESNYRALTYAQATNLDSYRDYDFSADPSAGTSYYGYNRQSFRDWALMSEIAWNLGGDSKLVFKPFYQKEDGYYLDGMSNGKVRNWLLDHDSYGLTAEYLTKLADTNLKLGYWWTSMNPPGPPTAWKMYTPTASGDLSGSVMWSILAKEVDRHEFNSLYGTADRRFGRLKVQAGLRYVKETMPGLDFYNTAGIGDVSYDQALAMSSGVVKERSVSSFSVDELLPFLGLDYDLNQAVTLKASVGRNYGAPAFDIWPVYQGNYAKFHALGITADQLWHQMRAETANAVDLGMRMNYAAGWIEPTLYYARYHHKSVSYDPGVGVAYSQNVGESRAWGLQMAGSWTATPNLDLFGSWSYDHNTFAEDLPLDGGGALAVSGLQLPDVPKWSARVGATWRYAAFTVSPALRYTGSRFGDTQHTQKIAGYVTADLGVSYGHKFGRSKLNASLAVDNLFDRKYVGYINASYYQLMSSSSAIYYPGAPRTVVAKLTLDF